MLSGEQPGQGWLGRAQPPLSPLLYWFLDSRAGGQSLAEDGIPSLSTGSRPLPDDLLTFAGLTM